MLERIVLLAFAAVAYRVGAGRKRATSKPVKDSQSANAMDATSPDSKQEGSLGEGLTKAAASTAVACYVAGLVVVNAYLFDLGISDFELLRPRFVAVGVLALGMVAISTGAVFTALWLIARVVAARGTPVGWRLLYGVNAGLALVVPWVLFRVPLEQSSSGASEGMFASVILGSLTVGIVVVFRRGRTDTPPDRKEGGGRWELPTPPPWLFTVIVLPFLLGYVPIYVGLFANDIYPRVPEQFGGGESRTVRLLLAKDEAAAVRELGIETGTEKQLTEVVELLFQGNAFYVVKSPGTGEIVKIDESAVIGLRTRTASGAREPPDPRQ